MTLLIASRNCNNMNIDDIRQYLLQKKGVLEDRPFGPEYLVYKVGGKMFALLAVMLDPLRINLKCDPGDALMFRDIYPAVRPGYHMNKRHWNTVILDGTLPEELVRAMIDDSYDLVVGGLPKAVREKLPR